MGDISREPLPGGPRTKGPSAKGPAEVIRLDELTVEERMETSDPAPREERDDDPAARAFPSPRFAPAAPMRIEPFERGLDGPEDPRRSGPGPVDEAADPRLETVARPVDRSAEPSAPDAAAELPVDVVEAAATEEVAGDVQIVGSEVAGSEVTVPEVTVPEVTVPEVTVPEVTVPEVTVPEVDDLVDDAAPGERATVAEPMLELAAGEDSDDAPPLTDPAELARVLLAVLLSAREPLSAVRLAEVCNSTQKAVEAGLAQLEGELRERGFPLELLWIAEGVRLATSPAVFPYLTRLKKLKGPERLSPAALETLAVIAYRQPVIRAEIEAIRGVKVGPMLRSLLDHKLVKVVGRAEVPGRPLQYGTTQTFLDRFGLRSLKELPSVQEFRSLG